MPLSLVLPAKQSLALQCSCFGEATLVMLIVASTYAHQGLVIVLWPRQLWKCEVYALHDQPLPHFALLILTLFPERLQPETAISTNSSPKQVRKAQPSVAEPSFRSNP